MAYELERRLAVEAVLQASGLCRTVQSNLISDGAMDKKDKSPVTVADFGAQAVVTSVLRSELPDVPMVGEEDAAALREAEQSALKDQVVANVQQVASGLGEREILDLIDYGTHEGGGSGRHWALDPIDGTKGFLRREQYAVALGLVEDGEVVLGVLGCPNLPVDPARPDGARGCLFIGVRGQGASFRPLDSEVEQRIHVSDVTDVTRASFCESVEKAHSSQDDSARVAEKLGIVAPPVRIDSQCKYATVARGAASVYLRLPTRADYQEKIWDHAAGQIVVQEAGGRVTDVRGEALDFSLGRTLANNKGVIVTNGHVHDEVVAAVREVLGL